jgi:hypothetical protein
MRASPDATPRLQPRPVSGDCQREKGRESGGAEGDRTLDLRIANATLSQLSYRPTNEGRDCNEAPPRQQAIGLRVRDDRPTDGVPFRLVYRGPEFHEEMLQC